MSDLLTTSGGDFTIRGPYCAKHGDQRGVVGVDLTISRPGELPVRRRYCMQCWIEFFDQNLCQLSNEPGEN